MLARKPDEIKTELVFLEKYDMANFPNLLSLLIEAQASSKNNPGLSYSGVLQNLKNKLDAYSQDIHIQQVLSELSKELIFYPNAIDFINHIFYFAIIAYIGYKDIQNSLQRACIALLKDTDVNLSYSISNRPSASVLLLKDYKYIYGQERYSNIEWDTYEQPVYNAKECYVRGYQPIDDYWLWVPKIVEVHFQKIPALFLAMADHYYLQYRSLQERELKQEEIATVTSSLDRLFCFAIDAARLQNNFALLNKFIEYKDQGFIPSYQDALQILFESFQDWMTPPTVKRKWGVVPKKGYTDRTFFQVLYVHFKPLIQDLFKKMSLYSLEKAPYSDIWGEYYHANDMRFIFRIYFSLKIHYSNFNNELLLLINQHASLILDVLEHYILEHKEKFLITNNHGFFKRGSKVVCDNEQVYMPEHIAKLIEATKAARKDINRAHEVLHDCLRSLRKAVPEGKDADKPIDRSEEVHKFYIALRDEDINHPIIKILSQTIPNKMVEPERKQILSTLDDISPVLTRKMDFAAIRLIYEYANVSELEEVKPPSKINFVSYTSSGCYASLETKRMIGKRFPY